MQEARGDTAGAARRGAYDVPTDRDAASPPADLAKSQSPRLRGKSITLSSTPNIPAASRRIPGAVARHSVGVGAMN